MSVHKSKTIIGRFEKLRFVDAKDVLVKAKVDTGAKTSTVHVSGIKEVVENDKSYLEFYLFAKPDLKLRKSKFTKRKIKSSTGHMQERYVVELPILFDSKKYNVEFSLSKRKSMNFEILLGRQFLRKGFIVDVAHSYSLSED